MRLNNGAVRTESMVIKNNKKNSIILSIEGVSKTFGRKRDNGFKVLDDVDIDIERGKITAVIGSNGAGKTSLFNIISGYMEADRGDSVDFSEKDFEAPLSITDLYGAIKKDVNGLDSKFDHTPRSLNNLLKDPGLYDRIPGPKREVAVDNSKYLGFLVKKSEKLRGKKTAALSREEKRIIKSLNRKLLQEVFPDYCPGFSASAVLYNKEGKDEIFLNGRTPDDIGRLGIGRLFQDGHLFPNMSIWDNMAIAAPKPLGESIVESLFKRSKIKKEEERLKACARDIFKEIFPGKDPFSDRMDEYFNTLSFGQQRILSLLRLFMRRYDLLLLDEPTAGVNVEVIEKMASIIKRMKEDGYSIVLIEHNWEFVLDVADYCYFLDEGRVAAFGTPADVLGNPTVRARYLGR